MGWGGKAGPKALLEVDLKQFAQDSTGNMRDVPLGHPHHLPKPNTTKILAQLISNTLFHINSVRNVPSISP